MSVPAWISNQISGKVQDEINYTFPNFNSCNIEVWEWISNFRPILYNGCSYLSRPGLKLIYVHSCGIDKQKFACLQDKVRTTQPITTKLGSYIPLVMLIACLGFVGSLFFFAKFSLKFSDVFFQGQTLYLTYLRNGLSDWCETKRRCIGWILGELCELDHWPHPWPWPLIFQGQISK